MINFDMAVFDTAVFDTIDPVPPPIIGRIRFDVDAIFADARTTQRGKTGYGIPNDGYK